MRIAFVSTSVSGMQASVSRYEHGVMCLFPDVRRRLVVVAAAADCDDVGGPPVQRHSRIEGLRAAGVDGPIRASLAAELSTPERYS